MSYESDIEKLRRSAERQGWRYSKTTRGHHQFYAPNKHDIITFAGTPGDVRGFTNSVAQMKKCGYIEPNGGPLRHTLGDALQAPQAEPQSAPEVVMSVVSRIGAGGRPRIPALVIEYLDTHKDRTFTPDEIALHVVALRPGTDQLIIKQECSRICKEGRIRRGAYGEYASNHYRSTQELRQPPALPPPPAPPPTQTPPPPDAVAAPATVENIDDDIAQLDAALAALGTIEAVVRRNRDVMKQFKELKAMLDKFGLKS